MYIIQLSMFFYQWILCFLCFCMPFFCFVWPSKIPRRTKRKKFDDAAKWKTEFPVLIITQILGHYHILHQLIAQYENFLHWYSLIISSRNDFFLLEILKAFLYKNIFSLIFIQINIIYASLDRLIIYLHFTLSYFIIFNHFLPH